MRFGVLSFSISPCERLAESWRRYEATGFDEAWIADDISWRGLQISSPGPCSERWHSRRIVFGWARSSLPSASGIRRFWRPRF
jgi:hypothetical protein